MKLKKAITLFLCILVVAASGCKKSDESSSKAETTTTTTTTSQTTVTTTTAPATTTTVATTKAPEPKPKGSFNNLTGLDTISEKAEGKRPVAIMINNIKASLPQYGIYGADIMFECPVEGGITRMMAIYGDYTKVPNVCSVRSCRYYYPIFAMGFDAVYLHCGIDKTVAADTIKKLNTDHIDGQYNSEIFLRDQNRVGKYASEHTMYVKGSKIPSAIANAGIRSDISEKYDVPAFDFKEKAGAVSKTACKKAEIGFSYAYYSTFTYDEKTKTYKKQHSGSKHMDSAVNKQLEYTNVFYLETTTSVINQKNGLISLDWKGGKGYYISYGTIVPIKWSKASETAQLKFTTEDGKPLKVNPGTSYIGLSKKNSLSYS